MAFTNAEGAFKQNDFEVARMRGRAKLKQDVEPSRGSFCERKRGEKRVTTISRMCFDTDFFSGVIVCEHEPVDTKRRLEKSTERGGKLFTKNVDARIEIGRD
ncbi:MAG TPA: hypothetical protein DHV12_10435 [Thermotogae bacterium]|nr:hypothetical protein [Thermotogota bacterium]